MVGIVIIKRCFCKAWYNTVLVRDETGKKTKGVGKWLIQLSTHALHNDLIKTKDEGGSNQVWKDKNLLVSDTDLRFIIPIYVKTFTPRYK